MLSQTSSRPHRLRRRVAVAAFAATAAVAVAGAAPASADAAPTCPTGAFAFTSTLSNGTFKIGKNASSTGGSATACGTVNGAADGSLTSVVSKDNVTFAPSTTKILFLSLPTTVTPTSDMGGPTTLNADGTIDVSLKGSVLVTSDVLGSKCSFPLTLALTTGKSGSLTGTPLTNDGTGTFKGKLVANDFTVPKLASSKTCNPLIAGLTNILLGLPLKAGDSSATFDLSLKLGA